MRKLFIILSILLTPQGSLAQTECEILVKPSLQECPKEFVPKLSCSYFFKTQDYRWSVGCYHERHGSIGYIKGYGDSEGAKYTRALVRAHGEDIRVRERKRR